MTDQEKELAYFKTATTQNRTGEKPPHVPCRISVHQRVCSEIPGDPTYVDAGVCECQCNPFGAVSVKAINGQMLGLRPDEFEIIAWRVNEKEGST
jgi:hypothetical protein